MALTECCDSIKNIVHNGLNCDSFTWTVDDKKLVYKILNAKTGELFESKPFKMCGLYWTIRLYPNGNNNNSIGSIKIFLKLVLMPYILDQIILSYTTLCPQSMASSTALDIYLKSGDSKGWLNRSLLLNEWKQINLNIIQIIVSINIFKIKFKKQCINSILSHYRFNQNETFSNYPKKQKLIYKIDNYTLNKFKKSYYGKRYESLIFNNMWRIRWFPNGANHDCASFMSIYLVLCRIPYQISKITTKYRIICKELNRSISAVDDFSFSASNWGKSKFVALQDIMSCHTLTFQIELEILNEIREERNDYDIWDEIQINYTLSINNNIQNNDEEIGVYYDEGNISSNGGSSKSINDNGKKTDNFKKEIKTLKKQMIIKDKVIDELNNKLNVFKSTIFDELNKKNEIIKELNNKMNEIQEFIFDDEKKQQINTEKSDIIIIKQRLNELQQRMDGNIAKNMDESTKKQQLKSWLINKAELSQYFDILIENGFDDLQSLKDLTKEYMQQIGIDKIGHQLKILRLIRKLNDNDNDENNNNNNNNNIMPYNHNNNNNNNNYDQYIDNLQTMQYHEGQYTASYGQ